MMRGMRIFFWVAAAGLLAAGPAAAQPDVLVSGNGNTQVKRYNGVTGGFVANFASGLNAPSSMTYGPDGNLYVSSLNSAEVLRYNGLTGASMGAFVTAGSGGLAHPFGLKFGPD